MKNKKLSFTQKLRKDEEIIKPEDIKQNTAKEEMIQENMNQNNEKKLPILLIPNTILLPHTDMVINLEKSQAENVLKVLNEEENGIILSPKNFPPENGEAVEFYDVGTILEIKNLQETEDQYLLELQIKDKVHITQITDNHGIYFGEYEVIQEENNITTDEAYTIKESIDQASKAISQLIPNSEYILQQILQKQNVNEKIAEIFPYLKVTIDKKQELLEINSTKIRAFKIIQLLLEQKDAMYLQVDIAKKLSDNMSEAHKQNLLREQMKMIQEELDMVDDETSQTYTERIKEANLPEEVEKVALKEARKLERQGQNNAEENIIRNYLDTILELPWEKPEIEEIDIQKAKQQLDKDHYGLEKIKQRILEHLAVLKLKNEKQGSILLFVGPPGTGKTSLGKSIAKALNRPYIRASLGGVSDESEIRGHRRTYLGALPGRIINGMKKAGARNPVFILDEIDKLTESINGNPKGALLEVLDPEQNDTFSDHYLEVPYDLSDVFFIATANNLETIPPALRDRLEIIELESYTNTEKQHIAEEHLLPDVLKEHGLKENDIILEPEVIDRIIEKYTREAGVRGLKREIANITRKIAEKVVTENIELPYKVTCNEIRDLLGREKAHYSKVSESNPSGVVTGLAWTPVGGDVLFVESLMSPGAEKLKLTGQLGNVMKESAQIAQSLVKSRFSNLLEDTEIEHKDIHIHVPEGAIPKDGPSAGVTLVTTIASLITDIPVDSTLAMTGEISLQGKVLPVGGIKEKVIAAQRAGIKTVLLPEKNMKDLEDVPDEVKEQLTFKPMKTIDEVIYEALKIKLPKPETLHMNLKQITNQH
ncbi:endopeptidase La [Methanosphaera cuniculi]|uniref:endopeptidase La n=1 Tax=Methanosphaera cuniculi TaxID=1077256 RepID=UPI0026DC9EBF|nr:endopeptidase La [Methanosphaera cuniculi]